MQPLSDILTGGYADLRSRARSGDDAALEEVARQFEAYFLGQMLKSMRKASFGDPNFGSNDAKFYRGLFDQQMAVHLASGEGVGFAATLKRQLRDTFGQAVPNFEPAPSQPGGLGGIGNAVSSPPAPRTTPSPVPERSAEPTTSLRDGYTALGKAGARSRLLALAQDKGAPEALAPARAPVQSFATPDDFVTALWPHAKKAGEALGVNPALLVAQAALETGWGKHIIPGPNGTSSNNLFGIKADSRWEGPRVLKSTLEFDGQVMRREHAPFRVYASVKDSFEDYVRFIQGNARYHDALRAGEDSEGYMKGLQTAGYATDPRYADKVLAITRRAPIRSAVASG